VLLVADPPVLDRVLSTEVVEDALDGTALRARRERVPEDDLVAP
jgi:hypothetical protein